MVIANASENIQDLPLFRLGVLRALGCQQRQMQAACELNCRLIARLLRAIVVALQFHIDISVAVDRDELFEELAACLHATALEDMSQRPFVASGQTYQPCGILSEIGNRSGRLRLQNGRFIIVCGSLTTWHIDRIFWSTQLGAGNQAAEVLVAFTRSTEQRNTWDSRLAWLRAGQQRSDLRSDMGLDI